MPALTFWPSFAQLSAWQEAAQGDEQWAAPEEELALAGELLTAGVVGDLVAVDCVRNGSGLRVEIGEELARLLALILGQHSFSSRRRRFAPAAPIYIIAGSKRG
jgi:hypothetical protein